MLDLSNLLSNHDFFSKALCHERIVVISDHFLFLFAYRKQIHLVLTEISQNVLK